MVTGSGDNGGTQAGTSLPGLHREDWQDRHQNQGYTRFQNLPFRLINGVNFLSF